MKKVWKDKDASNLILQDGEVHRTPLMMRDSESNGVCLTCDGKGIWTDARLRCPDCRGTGGSIRETLNNVTTHTESSRDKDSQLTDAETQMQDRLQRDEAWRTATRGHRPGFAIDNSPEGRAARAKVFDAIAEMEEQRANAWRNLDAEYVASPDGQQNVGQGSPSRKFGKSPQDGDACFLNGRSGTIKSGECVVSSEDSDAGLTLDQMRRNHDQNMERVYESYRQQQAEAYKKI